MATINVSSTAALNTALKAAKAGDTILLSTGTYTLNASGLTFASDVTIASANPGSPAVLTGMMIKDSVGLTLHDLELKAVPGGLVNPFQVVRSTDVHFERLDVHGSLDGNPGNDVSGLLIRSSRDVSVLESEFHELKNAVTHVDSSGVTIADNTFHHLQSDGVAGGGTSNITISGNMFRDFHPKLLDHPDAIQFWTTSTTASAKNIVITDNAFVRGDGEPVQGIFIRDQVGNLPYDGLEVRGNVVAGGMYHGISISGARNVTVEDNIVQGFPDMKSWIRLAKVTNATVDGNSANDVLLSDLNLFNIITGLNKLLPVAKDAGAWALSQWNGAGAADIGGSGGGSGGGGSGGGGEAAGGGSGSGEGAGGGVHLIGDRDAETFAGGAGEDTLEGGGGRDQLSGGAGDDVYISTSMATVVEAAGAGVDVIRSIESTILPQNVEKLELLGARSVTAHGNALDNVIVGNGGGNLLRGYAGADTMDGGAAKDLLQGDAGDDRLTGGAGGDAFVFTVGGGRDTVVDFGAGDILDASALLDAGSRARLAAGESSVTISFSTGESIVLAGAGLDDLRSTSTGWVFD